MIIYSEKIIKFINNIKISLKDVLSREIGLKVFNERFYERQQEYSYPINVVIFNNQRMLGYFDSHFYELGFHESLMHSSREKLKNIIRHELAHYMTFIEYGDRFEPHGKEFKAFCQSMGWSKEVQKATTCLDDELSLPKEEESAVLRKVQKLMALAESDNKNESEQAMIKSQQLLLKHNIELKESGDEKAFLKRIMKQKKQNAKMSAIAKILDSFFVHSVYRRQGRFTYLEIIGSAINVEIAEYVANTLEHELERLWNKQFYLKGTIAKNSFFLGVARGYCNKVNLLKRKHNSNASNALMVIEKKLEDAKNMAYPRLTKSSSNAHYCSESASFGEQAGRGLNINPGINNSTKNSDTYLPILD